MNLKSVVVVIAFTIIACKQKSTKDLISEDDTLIQTFEKSLEECKFKAIDSIVQCSKHKSIELLHHYHEDTIQLKIWQSYGIAKTLIQKGYITEALHYVDPALRLTEEYPSPFCQAKLFDLRGFINGHQSNSLAAASDLYQAADLYLNLGKFSEAASCYLSTSNLQYNSGNYELAIENGLQAFQYFTKNKTPDKMDSMQSVNAFNTIGLANFHLNKLDSASKYFKLALQFATALDNKLWIGLVSGNSAKIDIARGNTEIGIKKLKLKLGVCLDHHELAAAGSALITLAEVEVKGNRLEVAKQLYDSAWNLMKQEKRPRIWTAYYQSVSNWYELKENYQQAHYYTKKYVSLRDSTQGGYPVSLQLLQVQNNTKFKRQLADLSLLKAENEVKNQELKVWQISIVAIIVISLLLVILLNTINKNYKKLNELNGQLENKVKARTTELVRINKELDTYLYRSSHDVRRPILSIIGLTQLTNLVKGEDELREIQLKIEDTARTMDKMLRKLQMAYELDKIVDIECIELSDYIKGLTFTMQRMYPHVQFDFKSSTTGLIQSNSKLLDIAFNNILENACIFSTPTRPKVNIDIRQVENTIAIYITDNGIGIDKKYWAEIFKPYTRFSERSVGSGLGLHLAEKSLRKMNGSIRVESTLFKGSEFIIEIPLFNITEEA